MDDKENRDNKYSIYGEGISKEEIGQEIFEQQQKLLYEFNKLKDPKSQISDPLSEVTRKQRRSLMAISLLSFVVVQLGIIPEEITAIGFKFSMAEGNTTFLVLTLLIIYFIIAFVIYSASDFVTWRLQIQEATKKFKDGIENPPSENFNYKYSEYVSDFELGILEKSTKPISYIRASIEFLLPVLFAIYTLWITIAKYA